ncbi:MAG: hypothetical protein JWQ10_1345 [Herbaspirillum sp.]|nr:hypothetical protein [Herbaspirillum sp.]
MRYETFDQVMASLHKKKRQANLLLGNGFSMAYDPEIFSYNALYDFISSLNDEVMVKIMSSMKTKNFELMMSQLETFSALLKAFDAEIALQDAILGANKKLKKSLLDAIEALHPEHVFKISEASAAACAKFLTRFLDANGQIYTTNYDLLLYWVLMRQDIKTVDGFGRELLNPIEAGQGEQEEWSDLIWGINKSKQNIFHLHGSLPLFDTGTQIIKEQYNENGYLLENISARLNADEYPIFVTAGNGDDKLSQIKHNPYLSDCYDNLSMVDGSVITFGFGFGEYDDHIIAALNKAAKFGTKTPPKLWSIYIGTYSDQDVDYIESITHKFHCKVNTFDAKTVNLWEKR